MKEDLWRLRHQKRWTINELAERSGVPALSIHEYEQGRPIREADLPKLTEALGAEPKVRSALKPRKKRKPPPKKRPAPAPKKRPEPRPASESQIQHLFALTTKLGIPNEDVIAEVGRPLESLTRPEMSSLLTEYTEKIKERKQQLAIDPVGTKRWRAHLPEGVDSFELTYLQEQQDAEKLVTFTLFDGQRFSGRIVGFGPYNITIRSDDDQEITLQKLAIAYYHLACGDAREDEA